MKLRNLLTSAGAVLALAAASLTLPSLAVAAPATPAPSAYIVDSETTKATADARNYVVADGVTYFVATTLQYGRAIFSVSANSAEAPKLVAHFETGTSIGDPTHLVVNGNYIFFFDNRDASDTTYYAYVANITTGEITKLSVGGKFIRGTRFDTYYYASIGYFASVGSHVYFISYYADDSDTIALFNFDTADGTLVEETTSAYVPAKDASNQYMESMDWEPQNPSVVAVGTKLYIRDSGTTLKYYDTDSKTWGEVAFADRIYADSPILYGKYRYNGQNGLLVGVAMLNGNKNYRTYFVDAAGVATQIGNWTDPTRINWFVNLGENLYEFPTYDWNVPGSHWAMYSVSPVNGSKTELDLFPDTNNESIASATEVNGYLVFDHAGKLWKWNGSGYAVEIPGIASAYDYGNLWDNPGGRAQTEISHVGNDILTSLYVDPKVGFEPYRIALDGTKSLLRAFNQGSQGSNPIFNCSTSDANSEYILGNRVVDGSLTLTVTSEVAGKLKYSVYGLPGINGACGFARIGSDIYFSVWGPAYDSNQLVKMSPSGAITAVATLGTNNSIVNGFTDGTYYYYLGNNYDVNGVVMMQVDPTTGVATRLTGSDLPDGIADITTRFNTEGTSAPLVVGNKIYFAADNGSGVKPYVATVDNSGSVSFSMLPATSMGGDYWFMTNKARFYNLDGDIVLVAGVWGDNFYKVDPTSGEITYWFNAVNDEFSGQDSFSPTIMGGNLYFIQNEWGYRTLMTWNGTSAERVDTPIDAGALALADGKLVIADSNGRVAYYDGSNFTTYNNLFGSSTVDVAYAIRYGLYSSRGIFMALNEYPKFKPGTRFYPWGNELAYLGTLVPQAVMRDSASVEEAPAKGYLEPAPAFDLAAPNSPTGVTATSGAGVVNVSWTAPTGGGAADGYSVTSSPAGATCEVTGVRAVCSGLTAGTRYTFTVKALNSAGKSAASAASNQVTAPLVGSVPKLVGEVRVGKSVTVNAGSWTSGVTLTYQWKLNGVNIPGATFNNYTPVAGDYGKSLTVVVTAKKTGFPNVSMTSLASSATKVKSTSVLITGTAAQGQVLEADSGNWDSGTVVTYQWLKDGEPISGATKSKYKVAPGDAGSKISVAITGVNGPNSETRTTAQTSRIPFRKFSKVGRVAIDNTVYTYDSICAYTRGTWDSKATFSYQWYRNGVAIEGANSDCYSGIGSDNVGAYYSADVIASAPGFESVTKNTGRTKVLIRQFGRLDKPQLIGGSTIGSNLTFNLGNTGWNWGWTNISYQWLRNGVPIPGATDNNYTITSADKQQRVVVRVTVAWPGYATQVLTSTTTTLITK